MERMLVVVFDNEGKAYEGKKALLRLDGEGSISVYGYAVLAKHIDGTATIKQGDDDGPLATLLGTAVGSLVGILGGPAGVAVGATVGMIGGGLFDVNNVRVGEDFIDDVTKALTPGKVAVVAEVDEEWTAPVDTRMEAIGGIVYRRALAEVTDTVNQEEIAAMKADLAQLKAEHAEARADRQSKLQEKITQLEARIKAHVQRVTDKRQAAERRAQAKAQRLQKKADARPNL